MSNIVLDTNILSDFISQYFNNYIYKDGYFEVKDTLSKERIKKFNLILNAYRDNETLEEGIVISSSLAFIEIARKFEDLSKNRYSIEQFRAFINDPPVWFSISSVSNDLFNNLLDLPSFINVNNNDLPLEWADVIHVATALSYGKDCFLAATDGRLKKIDIIMNNII